MSMSNWSGPINSENGFITPITYIREADLDGGRTVKIGAGANIVILDPASAGPATTCYLVLPLVTTVSGGPFNLMGTNADPYFNGIKGSVLNYGAVDHVLIGGYDADLAASQPVNGSATGVEIAKGTVVQWGGNGNPNLPWAAVPSTLSVAP